MFTRLLGHFPLGHVGKIVTTTPIPDASKVCVYNRVQRWSWLYAYPLSSKGHLERTHKDTLSMLHCIFFNNEVLFIFIYLFYLYEYFVCMYICTLEDIRQL